MAKNKLRQIPDHLLDALMESPHESTLLVDAEGKIRFMSQATAEFYHTDPHAVLGKHIHDVNPNSRLPEVLKTGTAEVGSVLRMAGKERIIARIPLRDEQGRLLGAFAKIVFWDMTQVRDLVRQTEVLEEKVNYYEKELQSFYSSRYDLNLVVGESQPIQQARQVATQAAQSDLGLLITGETGTGKDLFAHAVHLMSARRKNPIVKVNCGAIPQELFESELFGYQAGAFTGASQKGKPGKFELANGGTIFLDEVGELPLAMQVKLLRVIQDQEVERLGGTKPLKLSFRVIAATNRDLRAMMRAGEFRQDLYYRLNIFHLRTPPLREIRADLPRLAYHILSGLRTGKRQLPSRIALEVMQLLGAHDWPGNVRELKNVLERAAAVAGSGTLLVDHLPQDFLEVLPQAQEEVTAPRALRREMAQAEKAAIERALRYTDGNRTQAAELLGIHRTGLHQKIKKYGLR
ncbi:MAG: sigma 54-interacting transcriptional regulator [Desulfarculaceae bacterium]|nr:sigma 54-interacting transcriptional regulator [Desulfarculaceae bacterium]MCF8071679.1 sigma 54-interacting transcriptional regulator [Desulfarculaceae bacterium]MCF8102474.1 sigma 54-interacting transcriptional regulator [Desulfarculaceae bacterium]MCF8116816.1 sigma 54-interacting transcriptional regulator [Desulfarculaceae bacterium]